MSQESDIVLKDNMMLVKAKALFQLLKFRLSFLVAFSAAMAYILASEGIDVSHFILFTLGGFLVTGSANIINQVIEKDLDKLMSRTQNRPLPNELLSRFESIIFCVLIGAIGLYLHWQYTNTITFILSFSSLILYGFVYTPLKRVGPIAVFVGAFPGAFPTLIGWVAVTGEIDTMALILFGIQFLWQFPHFWAIAWVSHDDYTKAGFRLLPSVGGKDKNSAYTIVAYTFFLIPASVLPFMLNVTGYVSTIIVVAVGLLFLFQSLVLLKKCDRKSAMSLMFGSFIYLPVVQVAFVLDKIPQI